MLVFSSPYLIRIFSSKETNSFRAIRPLSSSLPAIIPSQSGKVMAAEKSAERISAAAVSLRLPIYWRRIKRMKNSAMNVIPIAAYTRFRVRL